MADDEPDIAQIIKMWLERYFWGAQHLGRVPQTKGDLPIIPRSCGVMSGSHRIIFVDDELDLLRMVEMYLKT